MRKNYPEKSSKFWILSLLVYSGTACNRGELKGLHNTGGQGVRHLRMIAGYICTFELLLHFTILNGRCMVCNSL